MHRDIAFYIAFYFLSSFYINSTVAFYQFKVIAMPVKFIRSIFRSGDSFRVTLPMAIVRTLGIEEKDKLEIWLTDSEIAMKKVDKGEDRNYRS